MFNTLIGEVYMEEDILIDLSELFKVFGDSTRIKIMYLLREMPLSVGELAEKLSMTDSAVSHQLKILKNSSLVRGKREGKSVIYSLADDHVLLILNQGLEHVTEK